MNRRTLPLPAIFWLRIFLGVLLSVSLVSCANGPTVSDIVPQLRLPGANYNKLPRGKDIQQANVLLKAGAKREAASAYFAASKKYRSPERERLTLQAAELAASFNDVDLTERYLAPINYSRLNAENKARYRFTQAQLAINDRNHREVLRLLPQRVDGLPVGLAHKTLKARMNAAQASSDKLAIIQELVLQEPTLAKDYQVKLNNDRIWSHVLLMSPQELNQNRKTIKHPVLKGWLELGHLVKGFKGSGSVSPTFRIKLHDWQKHHSNHPGNKQVEALLKYKPAAKVTPYLGTIKPGLGK